MKWMFTIMLLFAFRASGQQIDYWTHLTDRRGQLLLFGYDNDYFAATDRYYSQGLMVSYKRDLSPAAQSKLFFNLPDARKRFGISIDHMAYTAVSIAFDTLLDHDHPFGATIRANTFFETIDTVRQRSFTWSVTTGFIGPQAMGRQMQTAVHKAIENPRPKGWQHQLNTGLELDLGLHAEQRLFGFRNWLILSAEETANAGTMHLDLTTGARLQFRLMTKDQLFSLMLYANPALRFVGYDGTMQGSLIGMPSEYVIPSTHISRVVFEREFGAEGRIGNFIITGIFQLHTHQYLEGMTHRWGGIRIAWVF